MNVKRFEITDKRLKSDLRLILIVALVTAALLGVMWFVGMSPEQQQAVILPFIGAVMTGITNKIREFTGIGTPEESHDPPPKPPKPTGGVS